MAGGGVPRRRRSRQLWFLTCLAVALLWTLHRGWLGWNGGDGGRGQMLDEVLRRPRHLCSIAREMGSSRYSLCKQSRFGSLDAKDIVLVSVQSQDFSFEKHLMRDYAGRTTIYSYGSGGAATTTTSDGDRQVVVVVKPFFYGLDWLPYLGRHLWAGSVQWLLGWAFRSGAGVANLFKMERPEPWFLVRLVEGGALALGHQLHFQIDLAPLPKTHDDDLSREWLEATEALGRAGFLLTHSKVTKRCGGRPCRYTTSWMNATAASVVPPRDTKINPLDPNANFVEKLQTLLATPTVSCSRRLSIPVSPERGLDFPSLAATHWPLCLEHLRPPCLVYSAKIGGSNDFEDAMERLGCEVFLFDPSLDKAVTSKPKVQSFNLGLGSINKTIVSGADRVGGSSGGLWRYVVASEMVRELGHEQRTIDVLRLDILGGEWDVLQNFLEVGMLKNFRQIVVTMHVWHGESVFSLIDRFVRTQKIFGAGFGIFHSEAMVDPSVEFEPQSCCHVVGWIVEPRLEHA